MKKTTSDGLLFFGGFQICLHADDAFFLLSQLLQEQLHHEHGFLTHLALAILLLVFALVFAVHLTFFRLLFWSAVFHIVRAAALNEGRVERNSHLLSVNIACAFSVALQLVLFRRWQLHIVNQVDALANRTGVVFLAHNGFATWFRAHAARIRFATGF